MSENHELNTETSMPEHSVEAMADEVELLRKMGNIDPDVALDSVARKHFPGDAEKQIKTRGEISSKLFDRRMSREPVFPIKPVDEAEALRIEKEAQRKKYVDDVSKRFHD
jgi:hypothetical protein